MEPASRIKSIAIVSVIGLLFIFIFGLLWLFFLAPARPEGLGWFIFAFATGLSMLVLPCTLPLAFVIVPMTMGKGFGKGIGTALSFGAGVTLTLSLYGVAAAALGGVAISQLETPLETVKNYVYAIAGIIVYIFALGEIGLIKLRMPSYTGAAPAFIQTQGDFLKAFLLGMFLGNIGVGCPHPATPLILIEIASSGDILYGWLLFLVHAIGRVVPLIILATFAVMGVNGLNWLVSRREKIERGTGWAMVFVAGFIFTLGLFTHDWWVNSGSHTLLEKVTQEELFLGAINAQLGTETTHEHGLEEGTGLFGLPLWLGSYVMVFLWIVPLWWWISRERKRIETIPETEQVSAKIAEAKTFRIREYFIAALSILLLVVFSYTLPKWFLWEVSSEHHDVMTENDHTMTDDHVMSNVHEEHSAMYHEESDVSESLRISLVIFGDATTNTPTKLRFYAENMPDGKPVADLEIAHEKLLHLIGMRNDLNEFFHVHPEQIEPGVFEIEYTFKNPGMYKLYSDVSYAGTTHTFGHAQFEVRGEGNKFEREVSISKNVIVGDYQVAVRYPEPLTAEDPNPVEFVVYDLYGVPIVLENYLAEKMHLAVISDDLKQYVHAHPEHGGMTPVDESMPHEHSFIETAEAHGGVPDGHDVNPKVVSFSIVFPKPGIYKMFAQFRPEEADGLAEDTSLVAPFYVEVVPHDHAVSGDKKILPPDSRFDFNSEAEPLVPVSRNLLTIVSVILIFLLSFGVKKYLNQGYGK